jgi:predicted TPR repeat methyltransferase
MSNLNESSYDKIADFFLSDRKNSTLSKHVVKFCDLLKLGNSVLDIGCGGGLPIDSYLVKRGFVVTGVDVSTNLLNAARSNVFKAEFIRADIMKFQTQQTFSGIIAWDSLFHLEADQHEEVFRKISDFLKNKGLFLFTHGGSEKSISGEMHGQPFTYSSLGPRKTKALLKSLKFEIIKWEIDCSDPNGYMVALVRKLDY